MKITAEPRSDQWNADDFMGGPRTFTISEVRTGAAEQKYDVHLAEGQGRCWRPPLTMLRLLIAAWGDDGKTWVGRRVTLYRDPSIRFGPDQVGGIRVSHVSHIDKPLTVALSVKRGSRQKFTVQPLPDEAAPTQAQHEPTAEQVAAATDLDVLRGWWEPSGPAVRALIESRVTDLQTAAPKQP